eukprot:TRINITY_DN2235_c0_g1_i7.p1 TRINITY_DN2235_c0_g1~~TRINITY_DN2235_c0_g1_i7.p1  ORF type:complete len:233 (+),score=41.53 TRINITY_DN2235_c0_g1_i7:444-1142(+)
MTNNIFQEQQENAFYEHDFERFTAADLEQMVSKYQSKSGQTEFPSPECIFHKRFHFLPKPLAAIQAKALSESKPKAIPDAEIKIKKTLPPLTPQKNDSKKKKESTLSNGAATPRAEIRNLAAISPVKTKFRTKLGVLLEDYCDNDSDSTFTIPPILNDIIRSVLNGKKKMSDKELELIIETACIGKEEVEEETKWVNELVSSDSESAERTKLRGAIQNSLLMPCFEDEHSPV